MAMEEASLKHIQGIAERGQEYIDEKIPRIPQVPFGEPNKSTPDVDLTKKGVTGVISLKHLRRMLLKKNLETFNIVLINNCYKELIYVFRSFLDQQLNVTFESVIFQPIGVLWIVLDFGRQIKYAQSNPGTILFLEPERKVQYLNINEVNKLQPNDMLPSDNAGSETSCKVSLH